MTVFVSEKHKLIGVPAIGEVMNVFPDAKKVTYQGDQFALLPHGIDETKFLRNIGFQAPAPVLSQYSWAGGVPFDVQKRTVAMMTMNKRAYVLNGMGTGKTKSALWAWDFLRSIGQANKMLVVAPLSTLNFTWAKEVFTTLPGVTVEVLHGTKAKRLTRLGNMNAQIYVVNHDGLGVIAEELANRTDIDTVVLDELAVYRNSRATRSKIVRKLVSDRKWVWGLTGSPTPNEPTDAWGQCQILTPNTVPKYFNRYRDDLMVKVSQFRWVAKKDAIDRVFQAMQPSVRYTLDDVVELPDLVERIVEIEMGTKQTKVYEQMERHARALVDSREIDAMNAGAVLNKLLQISTGYVYTRDKGIVSLDNEARMTALVDAVNSTDRKVIVFSPFVHALNGIFERLTHEGYEARVISGDTSKRERDETFTLFQNTESVKVLVAHPQTMAHGLTLTAADTIIWFAPLPNLEIFEQANARIRRIGQKHKQQILMFCATRAERRMYHKLRTKQNVQNMLLDLFAEASE